VAPCSPCQGRFAPAPPMPPRAALCQRQVGTSGNRRSLRLYHQCFRRHEPEHNHEAAVCRSMRLERCGSVWKPASSRPGCSTSSGHGSFRSSASTRVMQKPRCRFRSTRLTQTAPTASRRSCASAGIGRLPSRAWTPMPYEGIVNLTEPGRLFAAPLG